MEVECGNEVVVSNENVRAFGAENNMRQKLECVVVEGSNGVPCYFEGCSYNFSSDEVGKQRSLGTKLLADPKPFYVELPCLDKFDVAMVNGCAESNTKSDVTDEESDMFLNVKAPFPSDQNEETDSFASCLTPAESVFDPFAPCPEELVFAPKKRMLKLTRGPLRRRINFDLCCDALEEMEVGVADHAVAEKRLQANKQLQMLTHFDLSPDANDKELGAVEGNIEGLKKLQIEESKCNVDSCSDVLNRLESCEECDSLEEHKFVESIYKLVIDVIMSPPCAECSDERSLGESPISEGLRTPTGLPLLTGNADTCPGAPTRPPKSRNLSIGICRKLDF